MGLGAHLKFTVHQPLEVPKANKEEYIKTIEQTITKAITYD